MSTVVFAAIPSFEVVFLGKNHQAPLVKVVILAFSERCWGGVFRLGLVVFRVILHSIDHTRKDPLNRTNI